MDCLTQYMGILKSNLKHQLKKRFMELLKQYYNQLYKNHLRIFNQYLCTLANFTKLLKFHILLLKYYADNCLSNIILKVQEQLFYLGTYRFQYLIYNFHQCISLFLLNIHKQVSILQSSAHIFHLHKG